MIPHSERYRLAHDEALAAAIAAIDTTDEADAAAQVSQALSDAKAAGIKALAVAVVVEAGQRAREIEQAAAKAKADVARRERVERDGRKALDKVFGKMGAKVSVFGTYTICTLHDVVLAVPSGQLDAFRDRLLRELNTRPEEGQTVVGYALAKAVEPDDLDAVVTDVDEAVELVRDAHTAALERSEAAARRKAEENAAIRADAEQRKLYGLMPPPRWDRRSIVEALRADAARRGRPPTEREWTSSPNGGWGKSRPTAQTCKLVFGSWNAALMAAGFEPRAPGRHTTRRVACPACGHQYHAPAEVAEAPAAA